MQKKSTSNINYIFLHRLIYEHITKEKYVEIVL